MKVSIVIPALNEADQIQGAIRASQAQLYADFEIIVVDNGSTDETASRARECGAIVISEPHRGLSSARECGRRIARGEIIANIDADCRPSPLWLARAIGHFDDDEVSGVSGPYDYYDSGPVFRKSALNIQRYVYRPLNSILQLPFLRLGAITNGGNGLFRASTLESAGGYDTSLEFYGEDIETAKRAARFGKIIFDPWLTMKTSARRFREQGIFMTEGRYVGHFLKHCFSN